MNQFSGYAKPVAGGYHGMLRFAEDGQAEPILSKLGKPQVFASKLEATQAVLDHLLAYFNGKLRRHGETASTAKIAAEKIFRKGRAIPVSHVGD